ncbi:hypothetical protein POWCR01_000161400 [Plasmodium ovale]|uniref:Uncharacterized protein n=1 Tax=Plasmodium ovale TaxID=36330 RepID=A0A1C3KJ41_PLAOA|nr:hypothetical protein POWCR01_000161400 [Plasmodium ovale]
MKNARKITVFIFLMSLIYIKSLKKYVLMKEYQDVQNIGKNSKKKYKETSDIESKCKELYDKLRFYKVKMSLDIGGEEK